MVRDGIVWSVKTSGSPFASDVRCQKILEDTTYHDGCRYQVGMLRADDRGSLPNNSLSALVQIKSLERRLDKKVELKNSNAHTITSDLDKGCVVEIENKNCFKVDCPQEWSLSHHPVFHPHKPSKARRLLNGAAEFHSSSLKNELLSGLGLLQNLIHVLIQFRQYQNAVCAGIEGMFLQIGVIPQDQPSLCFFVPGGPSWKNRSLTKRASHFRSEWIANMRQLCAETERSRQRNHLSRSHSKRERQLLHGRLPRVESHCRRSHTEGTRLHENVSQG